LSSNTQDFSGFNFLLVICPLFFLLQYPCVYIYRYSSFLAGQSMSSLTQSTHAFAKSMVQNGWKMSMGLSIGLLEKCRIVFLLVKREELSIRSCRGIKLIVRAPLLGKQQSNPIKQMSNLLYHLIISSLSNNTVYGRRLVPSIFHIEWSILYIEKTKNKKNGRFFLTTINILTILTKT
jgi:hypothetical protein